MMRKTNDVTRYTVLLLCITVGWVLSLKAQDFPPDDGEQAPDAFLELEEPAAQDENENLDFLFAEPEADDEDELDFLIDEPEAEVNDLDFLYDDPEPAVQADDLDFLFEAPEQPSVEPLPAPAEPDMLDDFEDVPDAARPEVEPLPEMPERMAIPVDELDDDESARMIAAQEEIRRQAMEIEARRRITEARDAATRNEYRQALTLYERAMQRLPVRQENEALRLTLQRERIEVLYQVLLDQVRTGTREEVIAAHEAAMRALQAAPGHRGLQRLVSSAERQIARLAPPPTPPAYASEAVMARRRQVRALLDEARGFLRNLDLQRAQTLYETVLSIDPDNPEAMRYLQELHEQRYMIGSLEREATTRDMIATVRDTWRPRDYEAIDIIRDEDLEPPPTVSLLDVMERIIIPEIEFRQANIHDVVDFLVRASIEGDFRPERRGVNIILNLRPGRPDPGAPAPRAVDPFADFTPGAPADRPRDDITVTFTARFISLRQALQIITQVAGLQYHIEDNIVLIVPLDYPIHRIIHKMYPVEPTLIELVERDRATAPAAGADPFRSMGPVGIQRERGPVQQFFEQFGVPFPAGATIAHHPAIGKLAVGNTAENLVIFERVLSELNVVPSQVEIEARFVEVNQTDLEEFGLQWLLDDNWQVLQRQGQEHLPLSARQRIEVGRNADQGGMTRGLRFANPVGQVPVGGGEGTLGSIMTISSVLTNPEFSVVINALAQKGHADVLSAPKVTTRAGQEANIRVVTEYIYPTEYEIREIMGTDNAGNSVVLDAFTIPSMFETREVGVILSVLPEVSPDGNMINLTLRPEVTDEPLWHNYGAIIQRADGSEQQTNMEQPFFPTRTLNTQISIYDGATVVMGGLITEHLISVDDKIPFLGDIPMLGRLFRSNSKRSTKRNLLIFVTARLVDPAGRPIRQIQSEAVTAAAMGEAAGVGVPR